MQFKKKKLLSYICIALGLGAAPSYSIAADAEEVETIEVKGFRSSLNKSLATKRVSVNALESIAAEDIGKFPDLNIAESLQRVPGVAISREGGEGRQITLRGLGPGFTRTTLNGMEVPASTDGTDSGGGVNGGRSFDFNVFASELFNRVDIQKTANAVTEEGGIAGTVDMYSAKPFDSRGFHVAASAQGGYNTVTQEVDPRLSFMISNTFADDKFGVLFSVAKSERTVRQEGFGTVRWTTPAKDGSGGYPADSNPSISGDYAFDECEINDAQVDLYNCLWTPRLPRPDFFGNEQDRLGMTTSIQFAPTDDLVLTFDALHSTLDNKRTMYNMFEMFRSTFDEIEPESITIASNGRQVEAGVFNNVQNRIESRQQISETKFKQYVLSGKYHLSDYISLNAMVGTAESDARSEQYRYNMTGQKHKFGFDFSDSANTASLNYFDYDYNDPANYNLSDGRLRATDVLRKNDTAKLDLTYDLDAFILKAGFAYNDRTVTYAEEQINGFPDQDSAVGYTEMMPYDDFGKGFEGEDLPIFIVADFAKIQDDLLDVTWTPRGAQSWKVNEETSAIYAQADSEFELGSTILRANAGVRYVKTETTSNGFIQTDPVAISNSYNNVLPSLNLALDATEDLVVRLAVSKTMTRPSLGSLNPGNPSFSYVNATVSSGNPDLTPFVSTNFDLGFEWYFDSEALFAVTYFTKKLDDYIEGAKETKLVDPAYLPFIDADPQYDPLLALDPRTIPYEHSVPGNVGDRDVKGYEVLYQQPFTFLPGILENFGVVANFTHVEAPEIDSLSEDSYNFTFYYEQDEFGGRISVNNRSDYITDFSGSNGNAEHGTTGPTHVDLSAFYNVTENITVTFEAINLTDEYERLYTTGDGDLNLMREYNHTGKQFFIGARFNI
ncbi:TonB-dependent receptor [Catenovulum agarivorans]|uniref:TonB-dependent receptor n=1 Tax=Catenovulum agarivorans TaxID=1172192 RepID=UPI0002F90BF6|nr:TonB-dependent receptor [Catenovulum agarivorans]